jgi:hypothetical protein
MSRLIEFRRAEEALRRQLQQLETMKADSALQRDLEFDARLRELLAEYKMSLHDAVAILDPERVRTPLASPSLRKIRKARETKIYRHPDTGEQIETKGANHKVLKTWKAEHGAEVVEGWLVGA